MTDARSEHGFTLIEVLLAVAVMSVGIAGTLSVFGASSRTSLVAQRTNVAAQRAQVELDRLSKLPYPSLGLTSAPATSSDPSNPGSRVSGTSFTVRAGLAETFVLATDSGQSAAAVDPAPQAFTVGSGGGMITGKVYRFVTWRDEVCSTSGTTCSGSQNSKRATVAVTIDASGTLAARAPIWVSQVIPDPKALPATAPAPPAGTPAPHGPSAQNFYLYDTRCGQTTASPPSAGHATHNTASAGPPAEAYSTCENASAALQPDLMGPAVPAGSGSPPLHNYSSDLAGTYAGGLAMMRKGNGCPTSYPAADAGNPDAALNQWNVHAWSTNVLTSTFELAGQVTLSLFTAALGGAAGRGDVCATLIDRVVSNGVPTDTSLGSYTYSLSTWPASIRRLSFSFKLPTQPDLLAGHRLVLVIGVKGSSDSDLFFVYDHPAYASFLQVATSTPL